MHHGKFLIHKVTPYKIRFHLNVHPKRLGKWSKERFQFFSPEKAASEGKELDKDVLIKQDSWFLGVLSYLMITLTYPFEKLEDIPTHSPKIEKENFSQEMKDLVCNQLLNKDPTKRPSIMDLLNIPLIKEAVIRFIGELNVDDDFDVILKDIAQINPEIMKEVEENSDELIYGRYQKYSKTSSIPVQDGQQVLSVVIISGKWLYTVLDKSLCVYDLENPYTVEIQLIDLEEETWAHICGAKLGNTIFISMDRTLYMFKETGN